MINYRELIVFRIVDSQLQHMTSILVLKELSGERRLPVFIGENERKAILLALDGAKAAENCIRASKSHKRPAACF